jgi:mRNA-degrading endonuclease toxin of MazEF toxin-antitoxin module
VFEEGQIVWLNFPFCDRPEEKNRPAYVWEDLGDELLVSMITSRVRGGAWEVPISPDARNNLSKPSAIRIDNTIAIPKDKLTSDVPGEGGQANPFVFAFAREKMKEWLAEKRNEGFSQ